MTKYFFTAAIKMLGNFEFWAGLVLVVNLVVLFIGLAMTASSVETLVAYAFVAILFVFLLGFFCWDYIKETAIRMKDNETF